MSKKMLINVEAMRREINAEARAITEKSAERAKTFAPVRTGRLRKSIRAQVEELRLANRFDVAAARLPGLFIERGTRKMRARPFLDEGFPTDSEVVRRIADAIARSL